SGQRGAALEELPAASSFRTHQSLLRRMTRRRITSSLTRVYAALPNRASAHEQGLADFAAPARFAVSLPRGASEAIIRKLNQAAFATAHTRSVQEHVDQYRRAAGDVDRSSKARSRPTFRCKRRPSMSWSSTSRPRKRSASTCRQCCLPAPTRGSNDLATPHIVLLRCVSPEVADLKTEVEKIRRPCSRGRTSPSARP